MRNKAWAKITALLAIFSLVAAACGSDSSDESTAVSSTLPVVQELGSIADVATEAGQFSTLLTAAEAAGLVDTLSNGGPFTVFAPTDEAFAALPEGTIESLLADTDALSDVLLYHVVPGAVFAADVVGLSEATAANGGNLAISVDGSTVMVNESTVTATDIEADNGVIHVIDSVLIPPMASEQAPVDESAAAPMGSIVDIAAGAGTFETLIAAAQAAGLAETLQSEGPFTVFAPTDEAFAALPEGTVEALLADPEALADILLYHVVPGKVFAADVVGLDSATSAQGADIAITVDGEMVMVNDANVIATDIEADNGVIHVIDAVILPPGN